MKILMLLMLAGAMWGQVNCNWNNSGQVPTVGWGISFVAAEGLPTGGVAPYVFEYAPGATVLPGFQVAAQLSDFRGFLRGIVTTPGVYSTRLRCRDANNQSQDFDVSFRVSSFDLFGTSVGQYSNGEGFSGRVFSSGISAGLSAIPPLQPGLIDGGNGTFQGSFAYPGLTSTVGPTISVRGTGVDSSTRDFIFRGFTVSPIRFTNSITARTLPLATVGQFYSYQFGADGGTAPYTYRITGGAANGLSISASGLLSGTPSSTNFNLNFTIEARDSTGSTFERRFAVPCVPASNTVLPQFLNFLADATIGVTYERTIYVQGGLPPYSFDLAPGSSLPPGMFLLSGSQTNPQSDASPGVLFAKVQNPGTYSFVVRVTDAAGNQFSRLLSVKFGRIAMSATSLNLGSLGVPFTQDLSVLGGRPPYAITASGLPVGLTVGNDGVVVGTPGETGFFTPQFLVIDQDGESMRFNVNMSVNNALGPSINCSIPAFTHPVGANFTWPFACTGSPLSNPNYTVSLESGSLPPGFKLIPKEQVGGTFFGAATTAGAIVGSATQAGVYTFVIRATDASGNFGLRQAIYRITNVAFVTTGLPHPRLGVAYDQQVILSGNTAGLRCLVANASIPTGLTLDANTCRITGTPTSKGNFSFQIVALDNSNTELARSTTFTTNVYGLRFLTPQLLPTATAGQPYSITLQVDGAGPVTWLPASNGGITLNTTTGVLSGTTFSNNLQLNVTAIRGSDFVQQFFTLPSRNSSSAEGLFNNLPAPILNDIQLGAVAVVSLFANGGVPPYTVSVPTGSVLPPGISAGDLSIINGGITTAPGASPGLYGRATVSGNYTFRLRYTDSVGLSAERVHQLRVSPLGLGVIGLPNFQVGQPVSFQLNVTGTNQAATFALVSDVNFASALPTGLTLSPTGLISGTPLVIGSGNFFPIVDISAGGEMRRIQLFLSVYANLTGLRRLTNFNFSTSTNDFTVGRYLVSQANFFGGSGVITYTTEAGSLPPGTTLFTTTTGTYNILGASTVPGDYYLRVRANDATGNFGVVEFNIRVAAYAAGPIAPSQGFTNSRLPLGRVGIPYSYQFTNVGGKAPYSFVANTGFQLPTGMTLSPGGLLSGTPLEGGGFTLNLIATDADGRSRRSVYGLLLAATGDAVGPLSLNTTVRPPTIGVPFTKALDEVLDPSFGTPPFTWTLNSGTLPAGMVLVPGSGAISAALAGTPTTASNASFPFRATDANGKFTITNLFLNVTNLSLDPAVNILPTATVGVPYSITFVASGPGGPFLYSALNGDMPPGMSFSTGGVLSGTPTMEGGFRISVNVAGTFYSYVLNIASSGTPVSSLQVSPSSVSTTFVIGGAAPLPVPIGITASNGSLVYSASTSGGNWLSVSASSGGTPGATNLLFNPTGLVAGTYNGAVTINSAGASNGPLVIPVSLNVVNNVSCSYGLAPLSRTIARQAGSGTVTLTTNSTGCNWTATSNDNWISVRPPSAGFGSSVVTFDFLENTGATRTGTINVGGQTFTLTQFGVSCDYTAPITNLSIPSGGGASVVRFSSPSSACTWSPTSNQPWLSLPNSGPFSGTVDVPFNVSANTGASSRSSTITVNNAVVTVNQSGVGCTFGLIPGSGSVSSAGGGLSFSLATGATCSWTIEPGPAWIQYSGPLSGTGPASFALTVSGNSALTQRSGTVLIMGQSFVVTQAGLPCSYGLSESNPVFSSAGGTGIGSIGISTGGAGCSWTVDSSANWLSPVTNSGSGSAVVTFSLAANPNITARSAQLIIAGQQMNVSQAGTACSYQLLSNSASIPSVGAASFARVLTSGSCGYTAVSNAPWITISGGSYTGSTNVNFSVAANTNSTERSGTMMIAGQTFAVTQAAQPCTIGLGSTGFAAGAFGGGNSFSYTTNAPDCNPPVQSFSSWLVVTPSSFANGVGTVNFTVAANNYAAVRTGLIKVGAEVFTVTQEASPCSYLLSSNYFLFNKPGGDGGVNITANPSQCASPPLSVNAPFGMLSLAGISNTGAGTFQQNFTVNVYESLINFIRSAQLTIGGQILNIKQRSW